MTGTFEDPGTRRRQYLSVGNAINFRFWKQQDGLVIPAVGFLDGQYLRGSMYMWRRLRIAVERCELSIDANDLVSLDEADLVRAFIDGHGLSPLQSGIDQRLANLRDLGANLQANWGGLFGNVIRAADGSLAKFARLSATFRAFDDPVRKLTMVNAIMLVGSGLASFDPDPLPGVDYHLIKQALRQGLVVPEPTWQAS